MKTDALDRRSKLSRQQPIGQDIVIGPRDYELFRVLDRHGKLPSGYLRLFLGGDRSAFLDRLTKLYHGVCYDKEHRTKEPSAEMKHTCKPISYLGRDPAQHATPRVLSHQTVYHLLPRAKRIIEAIGTARKFGAPRTEHFLHQLYQSCLTASFELGASTAGVRYLHMDDIIGHESCPASTKENPHPLSMIVNGEKYIPDDIIGLQYEDSGKRFFLVEIDRATETGETDKPRASIAGKIKSNVDMLERQTFHSQFGIRNVSFLYATTSMTQMTKILRLIEKYVPEKWQHKFLCQG